VLANNSSGDLTVLAFLLWWVKNPCTFLFHVDTSPIHAILLASLLPLACLFLSELVKDLCLPEFLVVLSLALVNALLPGIVSDTKKVFDICC
jgi:hypothetical protein